MKRILLLLALLVFLLSSTVYAQPTVIIRDGGGDFLNMNSDGSIDANQDGFGVTPQTKTDDNYGEVRAGSAETDTVVWTPASGSRIVLMGVAYWADDTGGFFVETGSTKVIPNSGIDVASGSVIICGGYPIWKGAIDETLTYTTIGDSIHSILLWGFEE